MDHKKCARCGDVKSFCEFGKHKNRVDGLQGYCKQCYRDIHRDRMEKNPDNVREIKKAWKHKNREKVNLLNREWTKNNQEYYKKWRSEHKEQMSEYNKEYFRKNREKAYANKKIWQDNNPEKTKEMQRRNSRTQRDRFPERHKAYNDVTHAVESGKLKRHPCEKCGSIENIEAHHDDYSKQLDVRWLCRVCHKKHHVELRLLSNG